MKRILGRGQIRGFLRRDESGQVLVLVVLGMVFLIGMGALAVDVSHGLVVRHELQNAADASALAGAGNLFIPSPGPDWARAEGAASSSIAWNKSDGNSLSNCQVQSGYWNLSQSPAGLQSQGITPGAQDVPAVKVQVSRASGQNGGPMSTFFARIFGLNSIPVQAQAIAVVSPPGYANPGALIPFAISKDLADQYRQHDDSNHTFGSALHYGNSDAGQWTSFLDPRNDARTMKDLVENGNPDPINIGDKIYIQPGTMQTGFKALKDYENTTVLLPVVNEILDGSYKTSVPVYGFIAVFIVSVDHSNQHSFTGYFVDGFTAPKSGGSGPNYGALTPIHLVQ